MIRYIELENILIDFLKNNKKRINIFSDEYKSYSFHHCSICPAFIPCNKQHSVFKRHGIIEGVCELTEKKERYGVSRRGCLNKFNCLFQHTNCFGMIGEWDEYRLLAKETISNIVKNDCQ